MGDGLALSYVVPAHNSTSTIERTLDELDSQLADMGDGAAEILVVENGSSDGTLELARRLESEWAGKTPLRVLTCEKGLGNALREGILASKGNRVFLGADDLPFGFGDLDAALELDGDTVPVVVGSKAHRDSVVDRSMLRDVMTFGFRVLRWLILGMRTKDPQGTFILAGDWARSTAPDLLESGFLFTTELAYVAERAGIKPVEVPVSLRTNHSEHGSRIRVSDVWRMGAGLFVLRKRHRRARRSV
ncbi:glycosyltransferase involved in cell wall biosynthesis [Herbihabitans rhizosphaerae]|uniref:Glycosyltransferase involved in cell wall biosynthesis n=1 Tax=Herbihabitans rhizosphaerae TaxID=1872711 RepID=A0A4Q7L914_9PSEU|nr:glycosyltransferase [Herbihabitans rhizosphaerae]RZS45171.1 glycosyltransferase involved in cell wall biosynthesis [Herbihabitans rhizosphaerae]